ncbi:MAG: peroxidase family protein [Planctomycetes bacterium]|nr:peroxidase family protein [Planctomycetota bacterium]
MRTVGTRPLIVLLVASVLRTASGQGIEFRSIDGFGNNPSSPEWGSAGIELRRVATIDYADGVSAPAGATRPSARAVSNGVHAQPGSTVNSAGASDFLWQWGQFLDHDIDLTPGADPAESLPIPVPTGDPFFDPLGTGTMVIGFDRSSHTVGGVRQQLNHITSFIDASNVYGSDETRSLELRRLDGTGKLRTSAGELLPFDPANPGFFLAGDVRANEQVGLTSMHTLFVREHNFWCDQIHFAEPALDDDGIFLRARRIVDAEM